MKNIIFLANFMLTSTLFGMHNERIQPIEQFHRAVANYDLTEIEHQINNGINANIITIAFLYAVTKNYQDMAICLLEGSPDVNQFDNQGRTALIYAAKNGDSEMIRILLQKGANVNKADHRGKTALMYAVEKEYEEIIESLLQEGADVNKADYSGKTALMYASERGNHTIVERLIQEGAVIERSELTQTNQNDNEDLPRSALSSPIKTPLIYVRYERNFYRNAATDEIEWVNDYDRDFMENNDLYYWY